MSVMLRSGVHAVLRPLTPMDRSVYLAGFEHLGPESRRLRFFAEKPSLSETEIRYFTEVDHHDHEAIVALVGAAGVGVARYVRDHDDPDVADVAVAIADEWQRHGVGTALLRRIIERAHDEGIARLRAIVLLSNQPMLDRIRRLGLPWRTLSSAGGVAEVEISLGGATTVGPEWRSSRTPQLLPAVAEAIELLA
jgi:GNAT superfamily N-acetyltransferase